MEPDQTSNVGTCAGIPPRETTIPQSLQEFTIFSNLVPELRLKIWTLALFNNPRIIEILEKGSSKFYTPTPNPPLLSTCQESRALALQHYHLSFPSASHPGTIYFNPSLDTIYYPSWFWRQTYEWPSPTPETKSSIHHIAIEPLEWYGSGTPEDGDINGFPIFEYENLKTYYHILRECPHMCWCTMGDLLPEKGVVTFANAEVCREDGDHEVIERFGDIKGRYPGWSVPVFLQGEMRRDGKEAVLTDGNEYGEDDEEVVVVVEDEERERA